MITESLPTLKIHKLTEAQYKREFAAGNIDPNALYLTPVEEKYAKSVVSVKDGKNITVTTTYYDDSTSVSVVTLDDNGYPVSVVKNGIPCTLIREGF